MKIRYTFRAIDNLRAIKAHLEDNAPEYAASVMDDLFSKMRSLRSMPQRGVPMPELLSEGGDVRELLHKPYRVAYLIEGDFVHVLAVQHMRQKRLRMLTRDI